MTITRPIESAMNRERAVMILNSLENTTGWVWYEDDTDTLRSVLDEHSASYTDSELDTPMGEIVYLATR